MWIGSFIFTLAMGSAPSGLPQAVPTLADLADRQAAFVLAEADAGRARARAAMIGKRNGEGRQMVADARHAKPSLRRVFKRAGQTHAVIQWPDGRITDAPVGSDLAGGYRTVIERNVVVLLDPAGQPVPLTGAATRPAPSRPVVSEGQSVPSTVVVPPPPPPPALGGGA